MQNLQPNTFLQGGKYRIERVLGQGGFGNTYLAFNTEFEETVAIKEFFMRGVTERDETTSRVSVSNSENVLQFEEQREKFKKEARRLRRLKNEHIVKVHDLFEENGTAYYVMDYIDGESLAERLKRTGEPLSEEETGGLLRQILCALKEVHEQEVWHLDLKPGNIMVDKQGNAYLIDFGASKQVRANGSMTTSTALCYTPGFAPNEQIGQMYDRFGPWTDIYALGATVYNLLTNKKPPMAIDIEEDEEDAFDFPNGISKKMKNLVVWMMQPKRKKRPQSVVEVLNDLKSTPHMSAKPKTEEPYTPDSESTILMGQTSINERNSSKDEEYTILKVEKKGSIVNSNQQPSDAYPSRAIKIGDFIFDDGSYSEVKDNSNKIIIGVLFSYYGSAHGRILSPVEPSDSIAINGESLKWHRATIAEWVEIIQNLGHCKVSFISGEYKYFSEEVKNILNKRLISEPLYRTQRTISGLSYVLSLDHRTITPLDDSETDLPYIYISEF